MNQNTMKSASAINSSRVFETTCRPLEQFLFLHDIRHMSWHKNVDGLTVWVYPDNAEIQEVVNEYRRIVARRNERRNSLCM